LAGISLVMLPALAPMRAGEPSRETLLTGRVKPAAILAVGPGWRQEYDAYSPAAPDLAAIAGAPRGATLEVYFGSWCVDSRVGVPHLIKILDRTGSHRLKVRYVGVDRAKKEPARLVQGAAIERVPTFVLRVKGREIGRIIETSETTLEHDLANLVLGASSPAP
jgi:thiol-disulfide isomerase/thioredoxin